MIRQSETNPLLKWVSYLDSFNNVAHRWATVDDFGELVFVDGSQACYLLRQTRGY